MYGTRGYPCNKSQEILILFDASRIHLTVWGTYDSEAKYLAIHSNYENVLTTSLVQSRIYLSTLVWSPEYYTHRVRTSRLLTGPRLYHVPVVRSWILHYWTTGMALTNEKSDNGVFIRRSSKKKIRHQRRLMENNLLTLHASFVSIPMHMMLLMITSRNCSWFVAIGNLSNFWMLTFCWSTASTLIDPSEKV